MISNKNPTFAMACCAFHY